MLNELGFEKIAYIGGRSFDEDFVSGRTPTDMAANEFLDYAKEKAKEDRTGWGKALGVGAAIGGGLGVLTNNIPVALALAAGGALIGAASKAGDDNVIEYAKQVSGSSDPNAAAMRAVVKRMAQHDRMESYNDELRREQVRSLYRGQIK